MADSSPIREMILAQMNGGYSETRLLGMALDQRESSFQRHVKECPVCAKLSELLIKAIEQGRPTENIPQLCEVAQTLKKTYTELRSI